MPFLSGPLRLARWVAFGWFADGGLAVNPTIGCQDDAPNGDPGACYPHGGVFDFTDETWHTLPTGSAPSDGFTLAAIGRTTAQYDLLSREHDSSGVPVLDVEPNTWMLLPWFDEPAEVARQIVAVGTDAFVFGGQRFDDARGTALDDAWILRLGRAASDPAADLIDVVDPLSAHI